MGRGALPWPELLLCVPPAADAPENVDLKLRKCRGRQSKEMSQNLPGLALGMLQNVGGEPGFPLSCLNLYLWGQGWLLDFVKGMQWKQDGEMRPTQAWDVLCPDQPFPTASGPSSVA